MAAMHTFPRMLLLIAIATVSNGAPAAGESYMSLAGQLYGAVELPRLAKDHCASVQPSVKESITESFDSWAKRNEPFLTKAREQFSRANVRLKKQGASLALLDEMTLNKLRSVDSKQFCQSYASLLSMAERQFSSDTKQLLEVVTYADAELTKRGE